MKFMTDLHLLRRREGEGGLFILQQEYVVILESGERYCVPAGMKTDLASIPDFIPKWIAKKVDSSIEAAIVHDHMCVVKWRTSKEAAEVFLDGLRSGGVGMFQANLMYKAVLWFGPKWS